jgi:hypothetical protein
MAFPQAVAGSSPASPISPAPQTHDNVNNQVWSDNSDEEKKGGNGHGREDPKLVSALLHNSVDSDKRNAQKGHDFWKKIVAKFNSNITPDGRGVQFHSSRHTTPRQTS